MNILIGVLWLLLTSYITGRSIYWSFSENEIDYKKASVSSIFCVISWCALMVYWAWVIFE
jgi:hypothetical protein